MPKFVELNTLPNAIKLKFEKVDLGNSLLKNDVNYNALKRIFNENLNRPRNFGDMSTGRNLA
jgi:hypothetical protein